MSTPPSNTRTLMITFLKNHTKCLLLCVIAFLFGVVTAYTDPGCLPNEYKHYAIYAVIVLSTITFSKLISKLKVSKSKNR